MKKLSLLLSLCMLTSSLTVAPLSAADAATTAANKVELPKKAEVIEVIKKTNDWWLEQHADPGEPTAYTNYKAPRIPKNGWEQGVYFMGDMAAYEVTQDKKYADYAFKWAEKYDWNAYGGNNKTLNADSQACFVTYYLLSKIDPERADLTNLKVNVETAMADANNGAWSWIDAIFMVSPLYCMLYKDTGDQKYIDKTTALIKNTLFDRNLYDESEGLIFRDEKKFGNKTSTGKKVFWGRGNGWGFAALNRVLEYLPDDYKDRDMYLDVIQNMAQALRETQQDDGFWRASILGPEDFTDPEMSGTSLFVFGLAKAINNGWIDESYKEVVAKAWAGIMREAILESGQVGHAQPGGDAPYRSPKNNTNDFTMGAFLLCAAEVSKMEDNELWSGKATGSDINVLVNGVKPKFDAKPTVIDDRTLVPMRAIFETMGADIKWDDSTKTVTGTKDKQEVKLTIGDKTAKVAGKDTALEVPAQIIEDRTFVPLRFIAESLNAKVDWYDDTRTVVITSIPAPLTHDKEYKVTTTTPSGTPSTGTPAVQAGKSTASTAPKAEASDFSKRVTPNAKKADIKSTKLTPKTVAGTLDASPGEAKNSPDKAADGNLETRWACRSTNGSAWLEYEFDAVKKIDAMGVSIYKGGENRACALDVYVSTDGKTWTKVMNAKTTGTTGDLEYFTFSAVDAKYVRLLGWGANNGSIDWNSIQELEIYGK